MDTNNKYSNIYVVDEKLIPESIITFYINEDSFNALPGMTWKEWLESSYNVNNICYSDSCGGVRRKNVGGSIGYLLIEVSNYNETIISEHKYDHKSSGAPEIGANC